MANENKKDFNTMMKNNKDMPKIQIVEENVFCTTTLL